MTFTNLHVVRAVNRFLHRGREGRERKVERDSYHKREKDEVCVYAASEQG